MTGLELGSHRREELWALLEAGHPLLFIIHTRRSQMMETTLRMETPLMIGLGRRSIGVMVAEVTNQSGQVKVLIALAAPLHQVGVKERKMGFPVKSKSLLLVVIKVMLMM